MREADVTGRSLGCERAYETLTALPSKMREPATRHSRPEGPERRERTRVGVVGASPTKGAADAIVSGLLRRGRTTQKRRASQPSPNRFRRNLVGAGTTGVMLAVTVLLRREGDVRPIAT